MLQTPPPTPFNPFMDQAQPTMAALVDAIAGDHALSPVRRRNVASSVRRFCAALGYDLAQVPASHWYFRQRLKRFHPLEAGITVKRWQTIKSDVSFAFRHSGLMKNRSRGLVAFSPAWKELRARLASTHTNWGVSRLARFCSGVGAVPGDVDDQIMADFLEAMRAETFKEHPERLFRNVCLVWNQIVDLAPDLDLRKVTLPSFRKNVTAPWEDLPAPFRNQADAWLASMSKEADLLSEEGPIKPLQPASIDSYRYTLRQAVAALEAKGIPRLAIQSLRTLVDLDNTKSILQFYLDRNDGKTSSQVHGIAHVLVLVASTTGNRDEATVERLKRYRRQLSVKRTGLSPRPKRGLDQFADAQNIEKILLLPLQIHRQMARKSAWTQADPLLMQTAVALELLLMRPIRRKNLVSLRLGETITRTGKQMLIRIPSEEVKNAVDLDHSVPTESAALIDFYTTNMLPVLGADSHGWLFPGAIEGRHKSGEQLGKQLSETIRNRTGLYFYPHLARHFGAFLYLNENPGAFEVVRRVLAHKSLTTTTRAYVSFEDDSAVQLFDRLVLRMRDNIQKEVAPHGSSKE